MTKFFVSLFLLSLTFVSGPVLSADSGPLKIITYGDSLTAGLFRTANGVVTCPEGVSREPGRYGEDTREVCYGNAAINKGGYQPTLTTLLEQDGFVPSILNYGYSGIRSDLMLSEISRVFNADGAGTEYFVIMAGANDAVEGISASTVLANISAMVSQAQVRGLIPVVSTVTRNTQATSFDQKAAQYSQAIRTYAANNNILLVDSNAALNGNWGNLNSGDGLHLNDDGNVILGGLIHGSLPLVIPTEPPANFVIAPIIFLLLD